MAVAANPMVSLLKSRHLAIRYLPTLGGFPEKWRFTVGESGFFSAFGFEIATRCKSLESTMAILAIPMSRDGAIRANGSMPESLSREIVRAAWGHYRGGVEIDGKRRRRKSSDLIYDGGTLFGARTGIPLGPFAPNAVEFAVRKKSGFPTHPEG